MDKEISNKISEEISKGMSKKLIQKCEEMLKTIIHRLAFWVSLTFLQIIYKV